jgi:hypothetical protein
VDNDTDVRLFSSNTEIVSLPETVTIPLGLTEAVFPISINELTKMHEISVTASVANWTSSSATIMIEPAFIPESERMP